MCFTLLFSVYNTSGSKSRFIRGNQCKQKMVYFFYTSFQRGKSSGKLKSVDIVGGNFPHSSLHRSNTVYVLQIYKSIKKSCSIF